MTDLAYVERELTELTSQLKQSFEVLDRLAQVQLQFEELAQTHQLLKESVDQSNAALKDITQLQKNFDQRSTILESNVKSRWEEIRNQLSRTQTEFSTADRNLNAELTQRINSLRKEIEERFSAVLREWEHQRGAIQEPIEESEARVMTELKATLARMSESMLDTPKAEHIDTQLRVLWSSVRSTEKQMLTMRNWLVFAIILSVMVGIGLPITLLTSRSAITDGVPPKETTPSPY